MTLNVKSFPISDFETSLARAYSCRLLVFLSEKNINTVNPSVLRKFGLLLLVDM